MRTARDGARPLEARGASGGPAAGPGAGAVVEIFPADRPLRGSWTPPGDKSVSHRAAILAAIARGTSFVEGFSRAGDCEATLHVLRAIGVGIEREADKLAVHGIGGTGPTPPGEALDCRRSGTTMRLMTGVLASAPFRSTLTGHRQLLRRPMDRIARPLRLMGATVELARDGRPPISIEGGALEGIPYRLPLPSAQVKSAVLLAGLSASGTTTVIESVPSRDHTERLLRWLDLPIERAQLEDGSRVISVRRGLPQPFRLSIPADVSSAAFLIAAAAIVPGSDLVVRNVGLNPTRLGIVEALASMGGSIEVESRSDRGPEPVGDLRVRSAPLHGISLTAEDVPAVIDELPLIGLLATQAEGTTEVRGASELRVKESDRIAGLVEGLRELGADAEELPDGFLVNGPTRLGPASPDGHGDHRLAMTFAVAGLVAEGPVRVNDIGAAADSFPEFAASLGSLR